MHAPDDMPQQLRLPLVPIHLVFQRVDVAFNYDPEKFFNEPVWVTGRWPLGTMQLRFAKSVLAKIRSAQPRYYRTDSIIFLNGREKASIMIVYAAMRSARVCSLATMRLVENTDITLVIEDSETVGYTREGANYRYAAPLPGDACFRGAGGVELYVREIMELRATLPVFFDNISDGVPRNPNGARTIEYKGREAVPHKRERYGVPGTRWNGDDKPMEMPVAGGPPFWWQNYSSDEDEMGGLVDGYESSHGSWNDDDLADPRAEGGD